LTRSCAQVNLTGGIDLGTGCSGTISPIERLNFTGMCLSDAGNGLRNTDLVNSYPSGIHVGARCVLSASLLSSSSPSHSASDTLAAGTRSLRSCAARPWAASSREKESMFFLVPSSGPRGALSVAAGTGRASRSTLTSLAHWYIRVSWAFRSRASRPASRSAPAQHPHSQCLAG